MDAPNEQNTGTNGASIVPNISMGSQPLLLASCVVAFLGIFVLLRLRRGTVSKRSTILLVGPSDAGKTAIFSTLTYASALPSHTSLQPNVAFINSRLESTKKSSPLRIVDVPGHPRIRAQSSEYMSDAVAIVFVVDASTIARNGAMVAEHLHSILNAIMSLPPSQKPPSLLIHANKADLLSSRTPTNSSTTVNLAVDRVRTILERELEKRRQSSTSGVGVEGLGAEGEETAMGGLDCTGPTGVFKFESWDGGEVQFTGGWIDVKRDDGIVSTEKRDTVQDEKLVNHNGVESLKGWIEDLF